MVEDVVPNIIEMKEQDNNKKEDNQIEAPLRDKEDNKENNKDNKDNNEKVSDKAPVLKAEQETKQNYVTKKSQIENLNSNKEFYFDFNFFTRCCKPLNATQEKNLASAHSFVSYYMDVQIYLKKMLELELIKFCIFSKNEREILSYLVNPDPSIEAYFIDRKMDMEYFENFSNKRTEQLMTKEKGRMEDTMEKLMQDSKHRKISKRLMRLVNDQELRFTKEAELLEE